MQARRPSSDILSKRGKRLARQAFALAIAALGKQSLGQLAAFPGAVGFGADVTGGRTGSVYVVTNLNDSGSGSFRDAVSHSNRIIVFAVSGYEHITSPISASYNLTILGQTAPGGGFGVYGAEVSFYGRSNDIVQYMHFRDTTQDPGGTGTGNSSGNCVNLGNTSSMIFDHDSLEFASYNNVDAAGTTGANDLTFQNSIVSSPILSQQFNFHWEGNQGTFINNIFANAHNRSILSKGNVQFVNNTDYNYQAGFTTGNSSGGFKFDMINNYSVAGPSTTSASDAYYQVDSNQTAYAQGNLLDSNKNGTLSGSSANTIDGATVSSTPWSTATAALPTLSATASVAFNLVHSGDSLTHDPTTFASSLGYDQVDQQVINNVASYGTQGRLYNTEKDTGLSNNGLGAITSGTAPTSTANDGIPDSWKLTHGLSTSAADSTLLNPLGYTMIEQYAAEIADQYNSQTWSSNSGNWVTNSSNWSSTVPGDYDHALIRGNGVNNGSVTISGSNAATAFSVSIGGNGPAAGESLLVSGGSLLVYNTITVGDQNNGTLQITGGTVQAATVQLGNTVWNAGGSSSTTYTGTLVLSGGTLQTGEVMQGGGTPGNWTTGSAWTWSGGTLQAGPAGLVVGAPATLGTDGAILDTNGMSALITGVLSGSGGLTKIGAGTATVTGNNSFTGNITVNAGTLINAFSVNALNPTTGGLGNGQTVGRTITVNNGGTLSLNIGNTFGGATSTPQVTTIINQGGLVVTAVPSGGGGGGGDATAFGNITLNGGTLTAGNGYSTKYQAICLGGNVTVGGTAPSTINTNATNTTSNGVMLGANTIFNVADVTGNSNPSLTVSDRLTWPAGGTTGGGFTKSGAGVMLLTGVNNYTGATTVSAGTLTIGGAGQLGAGSYAGNISNSGTFIFNSTAGQTLSGAISGNGALTDSGSGTLILSGSNSYSGLTTISAGTLQYQNSAAMSPSSQLTMGNGTTVQLRADSNSTFTTSNFNPSGGAAVTLDVGPISTGSGNILTLSSASTVGVGGNIGQTMTFNVTDSSANNDRLIISAGALQLQPHNSQTLALNPTTANLTVASNLNSGGNFVQTLSLSGTASDNIFSGNIGSGGTLSVTKSNTSTWTLTGSNTYSGTTTISAGTLQLGDGTTGHDGSIANSLSVVDNAALVFNRFGNTNTYGGVISGSGTVTKLGPGTQTLTGANTYSGTTTIIAGTLQLGDGTSGHDGNIANSLSVVDNANLTYNRFGTNSYAGSISGTGSVTKLGAGSQSLTGANTYTGGTNVNGGTLVIGSTTALPTSSALSVAGGATVVVNRSGGGKITLDLASLGNGGLIDLQNNAMVIHNATAATQGTVFSELQTGFNGGRWNGISGIVSSIASGSSLYTLGDALNGSTLTVGEAYYGDADMSGHVDGTDYSLIDTAFSGGGGTGWQNGDFNYDGVIDGSDYSLIDNGFNTQSGSAPAVQIAVNTLEIAGGSAEVPEPTSLGLLSLSALGFLNHRSRRVIRRSNPIRF